MNNVTLSPDLKRLPSIIAQVFKGALVDDIAPALERGWRERTVALDVIDTGTYLRGIDAGQPTESGDVFSVIIDTKPAESYAGAIKRGHGVYDYVGQRAAEEGVDRADPDIRAALDRAGREVG